MDIRDARLAAKSLEEYWASQGVLVRAVVFKEFAVGRNHHGSHFQYTIRSDPPMQNGWPVGVPRRVAREFWRGVTPPTSGPKP